MFGTIRETENECKHNMVDFGISFCYFYRNPKGDRSNKVFS